jgi:excisionase family DNA binding protein
MSYQELAEQSAVYVQRIMELERQLGECSGAMQTLERELNLLRKTGTERIRLALTTEEAAHAMSIGKGLLYKLWRDNEGPPFVWLGADRRILVDDLRAWLESKRT